MTKTQMKKLWTVFGPALNDEEISEEKMFVILKHEENTLVNLLGSGLSIDDLRLVVNEFCFHRDASKYRNSIF